MAKPLFDDLLDVACRVSRIARRMNWREEQATIYYNFETISDFSQAYRDLRTSDKLYEYLGKEGMRFPDGGSFEIVLYGVKIVLACPEKKIDLQGNERGVADLDYVFSDGLRL